MGYWILATETEHFVQLSVPSLHLKKQEASVVEIAFLKIYFAEKPQVKRNEDCVDLEITTSFWWEDLGLEIYNICRVSWYRDKNVK